MRKYRASRSADRRHWARHERMLASILDEYLDSGTIDLDEYEYIWVKVLDRLVKSMAILNPKIPRRFIARCVENVYKDMCARKSPSFFIVLPRELPPKEVHSRVKWSHNGQLLKRMGWDGKRYDGWTGRIPRKDVKNLEENEYILHVCKLDDGLPLR